MSFIQVLTCVPTFFLQEHPFFTLHDSKETDVASFVKVILDD